MVGNRADSVQSGFFENGNKFMEQKYSVSFPWRKSNLQEVKEVGPGIRIIV